MLVIKSREKSAQLKGYESLNSRSSLSKDEQAIYSHLKSGFEGEILFDSYVESILGGDMFVLHDLLLSVNGSSIQIDALILLNNRVYLFEIKNYKGEYSYESGKYISKTGYTIVSPNNQLERTTTLFNQLMKQWNYSVNVNEKLVFINKEFTLFGAPPDDRVCLPTQVHTFLRNLNGQETALNPKMRQLANRLLDNHKQSVPFQLKLPDYDWEGLQKGPTCEQCRSFNLVYTQRSCTCKSCGFNTSRIDNIVGNIDEIRLLFPDMILRTHIVHEWVGGEVSIRTIRRLLNSQYKRMGHSHNAHYV
ncbi:nuclease-related domain-containing protein [Alkalibacterium pelagium]|uniref:Nuclease-related domain-containing protein n=1 Tax=Alkalibacterium pelagium TaxID=426702 RepID=A0A1H7N4T3_9LACT|nr:nuclease-related domain-containing protein [Alkalibacterium pelagium]SEL18018.1 Nuclease-related domain-containing protein [Alkalibacterium pelagium]